MPGLDHIFIGLGPAPLTPLSLSGLLARTCALEWELLLIGNQYDNTQSILQIFKLTSLSLFPSYTPPTLTGAGYY
jgi:hypothetical protein